MAADDLWKNFFATRSAVDERSVFSSPQDCEHQIRGVLKYAGVGEGATVLDLACGIGRNSLALARHRLAVVGLDFSDSYIRDARKLARAEGLEERVTFVCADMRASAAHLPTAHFDLVTLLFNSFGYFEKRTDNAAVFKQVSRLLKPGGWFVMDTPNVLSMERRLATGHGEPGMPETAWWHEWEPGLFQLRKHRFDARRRRGVLEWVVIDTRGRTPRVDRRSLSQTGFTYKDLQGFAGAAGLVVKKVFSGYDFERFDPRTSHDQVLVMQKPARARGKAPSTRKRGTR